MQFTLRTYKLLFVTFNFVIYRFAVYYNLLYYTQGKI
jgi:hypothetical protein